MQIVTPNGKFRAESGEQMVGFFDDAGRHLGSLTATDLRSLADAASPEDAPSIAIQELADQLTAARSEIPQSGLPEGRQPRKTKAKAASSQPTNPSDQDPT